jgi:hypothetical protein
MFEKTLYPILRNDAVLADLVSEYQQAGTAEPIPAIFSDTAPESAKTPYIVFRITRWSDLDVTIQRFLVAFDYFDYGVSPVKSREFAHRIEFLLDRRKLEGDRFGAIRFFKFGGGGIEEDDPRAIHYHYEFEVRAGRKDWGKHNITTVGV